VRSQARPQPLKEIAVGQSLRGLGAGAPGGASLLSHEKTGETASDQQ
jgi:hypothetical protein